MTRVCGDCQLCCKLMPVQDIKLHKKAGVRCEHQAHRVGCRIYGPNMPPSCRLWNCGWLVGGDDTADLRRPDRSHYVVDIVPDYVTLTYNDGSGLPKKVPVLQIWCDPNYPLAHRDPALRAFLNGFGGGRGTIALVRFDNRRAFALVPPSWAEDGQWHEEHTQVTPEGEHSGADIYRVWEAYK